jgi:hypothetical protein
MGGTNGFRLLPSDSLSEAPATGTVSLAAGGCVATIAYTWIHPQVLAPPKLIMTPLQRTSAAPYTTATSGVIRREWRPCTAAH